MPFTGSATFQPGIQMQAAEDMARAIMENKQKVIQGGHNDEIMDQFFKAGLITPDEHSKYLGANLAKKANMVNAKQAMFNFADKQRTLGFEQQKINLGYGHLAQQSEALDRQYPENFTPSSTSFLGPDGKPVTMVQTGPRNWVPLKDVTPGTDSQPSEIDPLIDPTTGKKVPNQGVVRKTGAVVPTGTDVPQVTLDPTGKFYFDNHSKSWKPMQPGLMMMPSQEVPAPAAAVPALSAQDQSAAAWAAANPSDPRAAAIKRKLGIP